MHTNSHPKHTLHYILWSFGSAENTRLWLWCLVADMKHVSIVSAGSWWKHTRSHVCNYLHNLLLLISFPSDPLWPLWHVLTFAVMWWSWASVSPGLRRCKWSLASPIWVPSHSCSISTLSLSGWRKRTKRTTIYLGGPNTTGDLHLTVCLIYLCIYIRS